MQFEPAPGFAQEITRTEDLAAFLTDATKTVAERASALAPDDPRTNGKDLHTNIEGDVGLGERGLVGRVNAFDWKAGWYEFGTARTPAVHFLSRALEETVGPLEPGTED